MSNLSPALEKVSSLLSDQQDKLLTSLEHQSNNILEPEVGIQITLQTVQQQVNPFNDESGRLNQIIPAALLPYQGPTTRFIPELNVHLIAARQLPLLCGLKNVFGYVIKVKFFPGSTRLESSIQTNTWPAIDEHFRFSLAPKTKPSIRHANRSGNKREYTPNELFAGQFVVLTVYSLLKIQPMTTNCMSHRHCLCKERSTLATNVLETSNLKDDKGEIPSVNMHIIGSVTYYLEPQLFKKNPRTGAFCTEEVWIPIREITETVIKAHESSLTQAAKGIVKLTMQLKRFASVSEKSNDEILLGEFSACTGKPSSLMKHKIYLRQKKRKYFSDDVLYVTTSQMRCSSKVKDDLECAAGNLYVKTCVFEHGVYINSWKSRFFYPSRSTKWDVGDDESTIIVPLLTINSLDQIQIRTTLETQTGCGKKVTLGVVLVGLGSSGSGTEHMWALRQTPLGERVSMWHNYQ